MINIGLLEDYLNKFLVINKFKDYAPNGLQIYGKELIKSVITGVTANQALIDAACEMQADAIVVHHGFFWSGESYEIVGVKYQRIAKLIKNNISLFAYHLPLDWHPEVGNNVQLANLLGLKVTSGLNPDQEPYSIGLIGEYSNNINFKNLCELISNKINIPQIIIAPRIDKVKRVAICSGAAHNFIDQAYAMNADVYITGEASLQSVDYARETGIGFISCGHHATERFGVKALGENLVKQFPGIEVKFVDVDSPV